MARQTKMFWVLDCIFQQSNMLYIYEQTMFNTIDPGRAFVVDQQGPGITSFPCLFNSLCYPRGEKAFTE